MRGRIQSVHYLLYSSQYLPVHTDVFCSRTELPNFLLSNLVNNVQTGMVFSMAIFSEKLHGSDLKTCKRDSGVFQVLLEQLSGILLQHTKVPYSEYAVPASNTGGEGSETQRWPCLHCDLEEAR